MSTASMNRYTLGAYFLLFFAFLVMKTSGILFFWPKLSPTCTESVVRVPYSRKSPIPYFLLCILKIDGKQNSEGKDLHHFNFKFKKVRTKFKNRNIKFKKVKTKFKNSNFKFKKLKTKLKNRNFKFKKLKTKFKNRNFKFKNLKSKFKNRNFKFKKIKTKFKNHNLKFKKVKSKFKKHNFNFK